MLRPDTYIGSIQFDKQNLFVFNKDTDEIEQREINYVPGLYKIFGKVSFLNHTAATKLPVLESMTFATTWQQPFAGTRTRWLG